MLFVHAHPDDETIFTGATMAHYAALGVHVTLVMCTLGEQGEIYVPELAQLAADEADQLGGYRLAELRAACALLGVSELRMLGGAGHYRDSGMPGTRGNAHPRAFGYLDTTLARRELADLICRLRPQVVVTYDDRGLTDHPDHVQAHRVTMAAVELAASPAMSGRWQVDRVYWSAFPRSLVEAGAARFQASAENPFQGVADAAQLPFVVDDAQLTVRIDAHAHANTKLAALAAHATQVRTDTWLYALATNLGVEPTGVEYYRQAWPVAAMRSAPSELLGDGLFAVV
jgi:N-acetyl-1-D-myo-inositol-2-amino-2-deoxy-alpha-D-glucopyranoside deacetylase